MKEIIAILAALAEPLGKLMSLIVSIFKKPLVTKEQEVIKSNSDNLTDFKKDGRP